MRYYLLFIFILSFISLNFSYAQTDSLTAFQKRAYYHKNKKSVALITGFQIQRNKFAELGVAIMNDGVEGYHMATSIVGITNEFKVHDEFVWGLKVGGWIGGGVGAMNMGLNIINYTNFKENSLRFRPEIGLGVSKFRLVYGYNLAITNKEFKGINEHNFTMHIMFDLFKLKEEEYYRY
ncbi:hypothetical protein [Flammeovirga aprica]|uniref:DUF3575 domain-containing protein n=1 Tax=Flammeovirga aprica JL-4 TaxID=694437 RepID=A0A7X9S1Y5_9BACT|nr:hypothetical protein [Flammeovirga aprica]NME72801.1 hypothetical protein [Flammeovirga aprica JL-4]